MTRILRLWSAFFQGFKIRSGCGRGGQDILGDNKEWILLHQVPLFYPWGRKGGAFSFKCSAECMGSSKGEFFCLGDFMWKSFDFRPTTKEGLVFSQKMLPLLCSWGVNWSYPLALWKSEGVVGALVICFKGVLGDPFYNKRDPFRVAWLFCWKKVEKSLESNAFMPFLDNIERDK